MLQYLKPLFKDTAVYAFGSVSAKMVGLILLPFYLNKLPTAEYGMLATLEATFLFVIVLASMNLAAALLRYYHDKELQGRQSSAFFTLLSVIVFVAIFVNIGCFPFSANISNFLFGTVEYSRVFRLMWVSLGFELVGSIPATLCRVQSQPLRYSRTIIIRLCVTLVFTLLFVVVFDRKLEGIYEAQIIGGVIYIIMFIPYIIRNTVVRFEKTILLLMFRYSLPLFLSSFFGVLLAIADRFSLNFISGLVIAGVYSLGLKLASLLKTVFVQPISMAIPPLMFRMAEKPDAKRFYAKLMKYLIFGLMFPVMAISMFGLEIVKVLSIWNPDYWNAFTVIPFIAFSILFGMMKDQAIYSLQIVKKTGVIASVIIFVSLLNVGLNILFIPFMGAIGAGLSMLLSQIIYFCAMLHFARKYYPVPYEFGKIFMAIGLGVLFCVVAYFIKDFSLVFRLMLKTMLLVSYPVILYLTGFYDKVELQAIQGFWKKWRHLDAWKNNISNLKF